MMIRLYGTSQFIELQSHWYAKLKGEGFQDIEVPGSFFPSLLTWHHAYFQKRYSPRQFQNKQRYYELAAQFVSDHPFKSQEEMKIWLLHSDGVPVRKIAERLKIKVCQAHKIIVELRKHMMAALQMEVQADL